MLERKTKDKNRIDKNKKAKNKKELFRRNLPPLLSTQSDSGVGHFRGPLEDSLYRLQSSVKHAAQFVALATPEQLQEGLDLVGILLEAGEQVVVT